MNIHSEDMFVAFEMLVEVIEEEINKINNDGSEAFKENDYDAIPQYIERAKKLIEIHDGISRLKEDFKNNFTPLPYEEDSNNIVETAEASPELGRKRFKRAVYGSRTYQAEYRKPILSVLVELGGKGKVKEILDMVEAKMKHRLNEVDYQVLTSSGMLRWHNAAQWERCNMVKDGLLSGNSPRGIWEITDTGRDYDGRDPLC